ncbi:TetR/AcrR family transcriptional regulator [Curtobacterium pusillum]|uniref:TetR/AcrR family transcriptional regulator n=1 Tax=Curtobacterium pusillum TaxID=69373 RepID=UPI0011A566F2|nr:TetR/AcrR family transcriptional regulator [Curtobacterium pusillum]
MRADAQRNRDAILLAARTCFEAEGINAPTDVIAVRAGVGNATLYRNFPTRDDLLSAVVEESIDALLEESERLDGLDAVAALREWMFQLTWRLRVWQDLPTCIARTKDEDGNPVQPVSARLTARTADFLRRAEADGADGAHGAHGADGAEPSVPAADVFELVTAVSWAVDRFGDDEARARERVELATAGVVARVTRVAGVGTA